MARRRARRAAPSAFEKQRLDIEMKLIGVFPRFRPRPRAPGVARVGVCVAVRETPGRAPVHRSPWGGVEVSARVCRARGAGVVAVGHL